LRTQESLPFLRRITSDTNLTNIKTSPLSNVSNIGGTIIENSHNESHESAIPPTHEKPTSLPVDSQKNVAVIPQSTPTKLLAATPMVPHRFVKNSFSKR